MTDLPAAGIWTGVMFILFGIFAKLSAFFVSIPDCLNGGLLVIIAAIVSGPGVRVRAAVPNHAKNIAPRMFCDVRLVSQHSRMWSTK